MRESQNSFYKFVGSFWLFLAAIFSILIMMTILNWLTS